MRIGRNEQFTSSYKSFQGSIDDLKIFGRVISQNEIRSSFEKYSEIVTEPELKSDVITVVDWNIWHGGTHFTLDEDGFDGIERIIEYIKNADEDIILMQETYGAGPKIYSTLGF
ncbi:MAG: hypothetical protein ACQERS_12430 [Bacteroidota bacterium]